MSYNLKRRGRNYREQRRNPTKLELAPSCISGQIPNVSTTLLSPAHLPFGTGHPYRFFYKRKIADDFTVNGLRFLMCQTTLLELSWTLSSLKNGNIREKLLQQLLRCFGLLVHWKTEQQNEKNDVHRKKNGKFRKAVGDWYINFTICLYGFQVLMHLPW